MRRWLEHDYPAIEWRAKGEGGEIRWGDETARVNTDVRGQSCASRGKRPVTMAVGGTRQKFSMISTVTNRGGSTGWQRGSNEDVNGLRKYLPKGTDLSIYSQEQLHAIANQIKKRPHKGLEVRSPLAVYRELSINSASHSTLVH